MGLIAKIEEKLHGHSKTSKAEHDQSGASHTDSTTHNHNSHGTAPGNPPAGAAAMGQSSSDLDSSAATNADRNTTLNQSTGQTSLGQSALGTRSAEQTSSGQSTTTHDPHAPAFGSQWVADTAKAGLTKHENEYPEGTSGSLESALVDQDTKPTTGRGVTGGAVEHETRSREQSGLGSGRTEQQGLQPLSGSGINEQTRTGGVESASRSNQTSGSTSEPSAKSTSQSTTQEHQGQHDQTHGKSTLIPNAENPSAIPTAGGETIGAGTDGNDSNMRP